MTIPYIVTKDSVTVMYDGVTTTVRDGMINYASLRDAVRNKDWDSIPNLLNPVKAVESFGNGAIEVRDGEVHYQGEIMRNGVTSRILDMITEGFDAGPLTKFLGRLMQNPSKTSVDELYAWLEGTSLPITEDGCFMAYKKVRDDYMDCYTGKVLNKPADLMTDADRKYINKVQGVVSVEVTDGVTTVSMPRNQVDDNRDRTCSQGLHFCSLSYLPNYYGGGQGRVLLVKVDPADVVSIPSDYDNAKGRAWRYQIVGEHTAGQTKEAYTTSVATSDGKPTSGKMFLTETTNNMVLGVGFGTEDRASLVRDLLANHTQAGTSRTVEQGRQDGFDDAWSNLAFNLGRWTGGNMRDAVDYARAYFEGYDRCHGYSPQLQMATTADMHEEEADEYPYNTPEEREEIVRVLNEPINKNGTLHGYDNGESDGVEDASSDRRNGRPFNLEAAIRGGKNYREGYISGYVDTYCW